MQIQGSSLPENRGSMESQCPQMNIQGGPHAQDWRCRGDLALDKGVQGFLMLGKGMQGGPGGRKWAETGFPCQECKFRGVPFPALGL